MKAGAADFAVAGGSPAFDEPIHVGRPNVAGEGAFLDRIRGALDRRWVTNDGPLVTELEQRVADMVGVEHCVAVASGTRALEILVRAAGLRGEVIVPSFTFVGTAHAVQWSGLTPRFSDVDPVTHTLDPERVAELIGPSTSAILGVHLWGRPCDIRALEQIAITSNVELYFDAAHAFACAHASRPLASFGGASALSFHATKVVHAFEGGAITTADADLAERARLLRNFGFAGLDHVVSIGTNAKMSEASAAMGLTCLDNVEAFVAANRRNHGHYSDRLEHLAGIRLLSAHPGDEWNYHYVVLEVDEVAAGLHRDELQRILTAEGVLARRYFFPGAHAMEPYRTLQPDAAAHLQVTEALVQRVLCLPTGNAIGAWEVDVVCDIIEAALWHAPSLRRSLAHQ